MSETHEFMERFIRNQREMLNIILSRDKIKEADEEEERHRKIKSMSLIYDYRVPVSPIRKLHAPSETSPPKVKISTDAFRRFKLKMRASFNNLSHTD